MGMASAEMKIFSHHLCSEKEWMVMEKLYGTRIRPNIILFRCGNAGVQCENRVSFETFDLIWRKS